MEGVKASESPILFKQKSGKNLQKAGNQVVKQFLDINKS